MNRKKFIKLMMAYGYTRNGAQLIASRALKAGRSYEEEYELRTTTTKYIPLDRLSELVIDLKIQANIRGMVIVKNSRGNTGRGPDGNTNLAYFIDKLAKCLKAEAVEVHHE